VSKPCQDQFLHPILVHSIIEKKENTGSQMGHTKKIILKHLTIFSNRFLLTDQVSSYQNLVYLVLGFGKSLPWLDIELYALKISMSFYCNIVYKNNKCV